MADLDDDKSYTSNATPARWTTRLLATRWILLTACLAIVILVFTGRLQVSEALFVFAIIMAVALIAPQRTRVQRRMAEAANGGDPNFETAFARFANALSVPCIIIDDRAIVQHVSDLARIPFPKLGPGMPISFSLRHPDLLAAIETCRATQTTQKVDVKLTLPNETWFQVTLAPISTKGLRGQTRGQNWIVVTMLDTTEQRRVDRMRADFVANASHELRTPLTSLVGFIETLQGPAAGDPEAQKKFLAIMRAQAERMSNLISDLLSLSRIELHQHVKPTTPVDIAALLGEVVDGLKPLADEAEVELRLQVPEEGAAIVGDRNELYEVFENLIDNAIKYGASGKHIDIALQKGTLHHGNAFMTTITDHGPGIASEHVPRLTERFYRVDAESSRQKKGTGLGLAIVKHIVNRHKGLMTIRSEVGKGTTVEISLPAQ